MTDETSPGLLIRFYRDLVESLTEPRRFYTERYSAMSFNYALAFGLIVNWLAACVNWVVRVIHHETFLDGFLKIRDQLQQLPVWKDLPTNIWAQNPHLSPTFPTWIAEASSVVLNPFSFLFWNVLWSVALTIGGYLFIAKKTDGTHRDRADFTQFLKLSIVTSTPNLVGSILSFLPMGIGSTVGRIYVLYMILFALTLRYRISVLRAFAILATPWLVLSLVFTCFIGLFGALLFGLVTSLFSGAF